MEMKSNKLIVTSSDCESICRRARIHKSKGKKKKTKAGARHYTGCYFFFHLWIRRHRVVPQAMVLLMVKKKGVRGFQEARALARDRHTHPAARVCIILARVHDAG